MLLMQDQLVAVQQDAETRQSWGELKQVWSDTENLCFILIGKGLFMNALFFTAEFGRAEWPYP